MKKDNGENFQKEMEVHDVPPIFIDMPCREQLLISETGNEGPETVEPCMPIRVYRKPFSVLMRILDDLTTPVIITVAIVAIEAYQTLGRAGTIALILFGAIWAISVSMYRTRKSGGGPSLISGIWFVLPLVPTIWDRIQNRWKR